MNTSTEISQRILQSILAKKLLPGAKLSEQQLASLFGCSRTIVREALTRLAVRKLVTSSVGSGWFVAQPAKAEAAETFEARRVIETGLLRSRSALDKHSLKRLRNHLRQQKQALNGGDAGLRSFLLGDFHVCLAECLGNQVLAETLRDLTARTTLIAIEHQSHADATHSCEEHAAIVQALADGDLTGAEQLMAEHLGSWNQKLPMSSVPTSSPQSDALMQLREILTPLVLGGLQAAPAGSSRAAASAAHVAVPTSSAAKARKMRASLQSDLE